MNYKIIRYVLGWVLKIEALCMTLPLVCAFVYDEFDNVVIWAICIAVSLLTGIFISLRSPKNKTMFVREGFVSVALSWIVLSIFGAIPFVLTGAIPDFIDALFETVSGFTTTGASILSDLDSIPKSVLFWRSFTHWIGGMGVLVFIIAIIPLSGSSNIFLIKAESPGPSVGKLVPKVKSTAKLLYTIYIAMTVLQVILLLCGGMNLFESLTISFGTAGTGGFAVSNAGLAGYSSYCQVVITVFMILFGIDFSLYYLILMGKLRTVFKSDELKGYLGVILLAIVIISINCSHLFVNIFDTVKHSAFQVGSIITTTGFATVDFNQWPELSKTILVVLMFIGACAGSTGGGIKVSRIIILLKSIFKEIKLTAHPRTAVKIKMNGRIVEHETIRGVNVFMAAYLVIFIFSLLIITIDNFDFTTNFTAVAATINNIGPGLGMVGPMSNFGGYCNISKVVLIFDMLVGRLEIFPLLLLLSPHTWKK